MKLWQRNLQKRRENGTVHVTIANLFLCVFLIFFLPLSLSFPLPLSPPPLYLTLSFHLSLPHSLPLTLLSIEQHRRQLEEDARLARQASEEEAQTIRERRQREAELSAREARRLAEQDRSVL